MEEIKFEPLQTVGKIQTTNIILSKMYGVPRFKHDSELSNVVIESQDETASPLLCRLCATRGGDMVHMFGTNRSHKNIIKKIKNCSLPIVVKKTDTLPKYACRICLGKLELCYQFRKIVAEAEKQLLMYDEEKSSKVGETEEDCQTFSPRSRQRSVRKIASNGETLKPSTQKCCRIKPSKESRSRNLSNEYKDADSSTDSMDSNRTLASRIEERNLRNSSINLEKELESEKEKKMSDSEFYSPPITRSQSNTVCDSVEETESMKDTNDDDNSPDLEERAEDRGPKPSSPTNTIHLEKELRPEKEKEMPNSEFYSPPITRSKNHAVCDSVKEQEARKETSDEDILFWEKKFKDKNLKLNSPMTTIVRIGKELTIEKEKKKEMSDSDSEFYSHRITRSKNLPEVEIENSPKKTEASKDTSDDDILFWEDKFKDQIFTDQRSGYNVIRCRICEEAFETAEKCHVHGSAHAWTNYYPCCFCDKTFQTEIDWKKHSLEHVDSSQFKIRDTMHDCTECGKKFASIARLKFHKLFHKPNAEIYPTTRLADLSLRQLCRNTDQRLLVRSRKNPVLGNQAQHSCEECGKVMNTQKSLQEHILTLHKRDQALCCNICRERFRTEEQLEAHQKKHDHDFECSVCKKRYDSDYTLKVHRETNCIQLSTANKFSCAHCGLICTRKKQLIIHMRSHTRELRYSCNICSKKFVTETVRNNHRRKHTGQKLLWKCTPCDKAFAKSKIIDNHTNLHGVQVRYSRKLFQRTESPAET